MAKSKFDRLLGNSLGFEDAESSSEVSDDVIMSAAVQPEDDMADMQSDATEIAEASNTAEAASNTSADLEEVAAALSQSTESGGLSADAAVYARLAIRGIVGRHSMALADAMVPSMEAFGGTSTKVRATASLEGAVIDALKSFWNAIVAKMKKLFAYVKNWIMKVFGAAPKLKARAEAIAKRAANITGAAEEKTMDLPLMHQLQIKGKAPATTDFLAHIKALEVNASMVLGSTTSAEYDRITAGFENVLESVDKMKTVKGESLQDWYKIVGSDPLNPEQILDAITKKMDSIKVPGGVTPSNAKERFGDDVTITLSEEMLGGKALVKSVSKLTTAGGKFTMQRYARDCWLRITDHDMKPKDVDNTGSFKTLSSSDIRTACDAVADVCDSVITYKKSWENREKQMAKIEKAAKKAIADAEKDKEDETGKSRLVKDYAIGASTMERVGINFETELITYALAVGRASLSWCERSLSQYKSS